MQCRKCNQFFDDQYQVCPYCGEIMPDSNKTLEIPVQKKQPNKILPIVLSLLLTAVPIGIRTGFREYHQHQYEQKQAEDIKAVADSISQYLSESDHEDVFGIQDGDTYENKFFGIGCELQGWNFLPAEELSELNQQMQSVETDVAGGAFAFHATSSDGLANVNIVIGDGEEMDETLSLDMMGDTIMDLTEVVSCDRIESNIAGEKKHILKTTMEQDGFSTCLYQFIYFQNNKHAIVTVRAFAESDVENICSSFYKVNDD